MKRTVVAWRHYLSTTNLASMRTFYLEEILRSYIWFINQINSRRNNISMDGKRKGRLNLKSSEIIKRRYSLRSCTYLTKYLIVRSPHDPRVFNEFAKTTFNKCLILQYAFLKNLFCSSFSFVANAYTGRYSTITKRNSWVKLSDKQFKHVH